MRTGGRGTSGSQKDEVLSRLYQQVTELQAAWFGAGYDIAAGLDQYETWLREHTAEDQATLDATPAGPMAVQASAGAAAPDPGQAVIVASTTRTPGSIHSDIPGPGAEWDADRAVTTLYTAHYWYLVRLAAFLVHDTATAEELVQDSFVAMHSAWRRLRDSDHALSYLRQSVVNRSRSVLRHRAVVDKIAPKLAPDTPGTEQQPVIQPDRSTLLSALRTLPARQREVLVLRYYAGLSDAQIASAMGISKSAVKSHTARAMSALRTELHKTNESRSSSGPESADTAGHQRDRIT
jgi:RNA polymerase sigma-70 factor (sigma-E family)